MGDFNAIRWDHEKRGGALSEISSNQQFNDCIDGCGLDDFPVSGPHFTWSNSSTGLNRVECRFDRILLNQLFTQSSINFSSSVLCPGTSDHSPLLLSSADDATVRCPFRFFNAWIKEESFFQVVKEA